MVQQPCNVEVYAYAAAQVKEGVEITRELGGENCVFWGGREGYQCLYNTDMKRSLIIWGVSSTWLSTMQRNRFWRPVLD